MRNGKKRNGSIRRRGGIEFFLTDEQIRKWRRVPLRHKLMWLEEANRFNAQVLRGRRLKIFEAFRAGNI